MDRLCTIDKGYIVSYLEYDYRVYYVERGSQEVYEFTKDDKVNDLKDAEIIFAIKKG